MKREELLRNKDYIVTQMQLSLLDLIGSYKEKNHLKDYQLAEKLGVSKGYVSQLLNASFDHKISKVVDLALVCDVMPLLHFVDMNDFIANDEQDKVYTAFPVARHKNVDYEQPLMLDEEKSKYVFKTQSEFSGSYTVDHKTTQLKIAHSQS